MQEAIGWEKRRRRVFLTNKYFLKEFIFICFTVLLCSHPAYAKQSLETYLPNGQPFIFYSIYDEGEKYEGADAPSTWTLGKEHIAAVNSATHYWGGLVRNNRSGTMLNMALYTNNDENAEAHTDFDANH